MCRRKTACEITNLIPHSKIKTTKTLQHLAYLNKYIWKYRYRFSLGFLFVLISNIFALYPAEFVRKSFDSIKYLLTKNEIPSGDYTDILLKFGGLIILFAILKGVFMFFMRQTIIVMSRKIEFDLKNEIYNHYQQLNITFYKKNNQEPLEKRQI